MSGSYVPSHVDAWNINNNNFKKTWDAFTHGSFCNGTHLKETSDKEASLLIANSDLTLWTHLTHSMLQLDSIMSYSHNTFFVSITVLIWTLSDQNTKKQDRQSDRKWKQEEEEEKERKEWHIKKEKWNSLFYPNGMEDNDLTLNNRFREHTQHFLCSVYYIRH